MPKYISAFGGIAKGALDKAYVAVGMRVLEGPAAIGEEHSKPYARALIADLAENRLIHTLFSEQPNGRMSLGGPTIQEYVQDGAGRRTNWPDLDLYYKVLYASDRKQGGAGEFPYPAFLRVLLNCGVTVYCYDVNPEPDKRRPELGSATNMKFRNEAMASTVLHENCIRRPGVVLLNGAKHFKRISDSKADCTGLHTLCDIPDRAVFKLADLG